MYLCVSWVAKQQTLRTTALNSQLDLTNQLIIFSLDHPIRLITQIQVFKHYLSNEQLQNTISSINYWNEYHLYHFHLLRAKLQTQFMGSVHFKCSIHNFWLTLYRSHLILDHLHISSSLLCRKNRFRKQQRSRCVRRQGFLHRPYVLRDRARYHRHQESEPQETRNSSSNNL